jgi:hypothetical protein
VLGRSCCGQEGKYFLQLTEWTTLGLESGVWIKQENEHKWMMLVQRRREREQLGARISVGFF